MRSTISALLQEMQTACRRTVYDANAIVISCSRTQKEAPCTGDDSGTDKSFPSKRRKRENREKPRTWEEMLSEAAILLPAMTDAEHGVVWRLASIMLLGFLLPQSTGNDFFLLQNVSTRSHRSHNQAAGTQTSERFLSNEMMGDYFFHMPLDERLESIPQKYAPEDFGELGSIVEENWNASFCAFVSRGLVPLLSGRPAHSRQVDLLHLIAMVVHPHPSIQPIRATVTELQGEKSEAWSNTKQLLSSLVPHSFHVNYQHRLMMVRLIADSLNVPEYSSERMLLDAPLFQGALLHLRASLYAFGMASIHPYDAHWAQRGLVSVAIQVGTSVIVREEWGRLLNRLMDDDRASCQCCCPNATHIDSGSQKGNILEQQQALTKRLSVTDPSQKTIESTSAKESFASGTRVGFVSTRVGSTIFCPHRAQGELLQHFLTRFSEARHFADAEFLQHVLASLTDAIEYKVDCWTKTTNGDNDGGNSDEFPTQEDIVRNEKSTVSKKEKETDASVNTGIVDSARGGSEDTMDEDAKENGDTVSNAKAYTTNESSCVLASLLFAAKPLFYFLLPVIHGNRESDGEESEDSQRRDMLVSCAIQLVHHWNSNVAEQASKLLILAFSYGSSQMVSDYAGAIFETTKFAISKALDPSINRHAPIEGLMATFAAKSSKFGEETLKLLLAKDKKDPGATLVISRLIAAIAMSCPRAAFKRKSELLEWLQNDNLPEPTKVQVFASILACRRAHFFNKTDDRIQGYTEQFTESQPSGWNLYILGRQALAFGNFDVAAALYEELMALCSSEKAFVWLLALKSIAQAEASLLSFGAKGTSTATIHIRKAISSIHSLESASERSKNSATAFQLRVLNLRLDFLELILTIRQHTQEMRLTTEGPKKSTRSSVHLRNAIKFLNVLASKYLALYRQHGIFVCQQSRTSLRTLHALCRFVANAARSTFIGELPDATISDFQKDAIQALTHPKGEASHPIRVLMAHLDSSVLKDMNSSVDTKLRAAAMIQVLDGALKVPSPFPRSFVVMRKFPCAQLRLSLDSELPDEHGDIDEENEEEIDVQVGDTVSFIASGSIPKSLMERANLPFNIVLLWCTSTLRTNDESKEGKQDEDLASTSGIRNLSNSWNVGLQAPTAVSLSPRGTFFMQVECESIRNAGLYSIETTLGCRDVRGGEWELPVKEGSHTIHVRASR